MLSKNTVKEKRQNVEYDKILQYVCLTEDLCPKRRVKRFQIDKITMIEKWVKGFGQITLRRCVANKDVKTA